MSFKNIIGNDKIKLLLNQMVEKNHILHSYLFVGIDGIGKTLFAKEFARKLLCLEQENEQNCISCIKWQSQNHPDFYQIEPENKIIKIEQIRAMQEKILEKPIISNRKVYIIIDSDTMTKEAQNCLLKTLEEPPEYATIILTCSNGAKLLTTIKSRCMKVSFLGIEEDKIKEYIQKELKIEPSINLIKKCEGSIGKAIELQTKKEIYEQIDEVLEQIEKNDLITTMNKAECLYKEKEKIQEILEYIIIALFNTKKKEQLNCISYVEETKRRILANSNYDMSIDYLLMNLWEEINEKYCRSSI